MSTGKGIVFLADGFEEIEAVTVIDILRRGGIDVLTVSIMDKLQVTGAHNVVITCDLMFAAMADDADILILPGGGVGTQNLKNHNGLAEKLKSFNTDKKWIAAICAAPTVLEANGILKDKTAVCYPTLEGELKSAQIGRGPVEVCGNIITSKGPGTSGAFSFKILELLKGSAVAESLKKEMIFS